jgi:hypothetical protein
MDNVSPGMFCWLYGSMYFSSIKRLFASQRGGCSIGFTGTAVLGAAPASSG